MLVVKFSNVGVEGSPLIIEGLARETPTQTLGQQLGDIFCSSWQFYAVVQSVR